MAARIPLVLMLGTKSNYQQPFCEFMAVWSKQGDILVREYGNTSFWNFRLAS